MSDVRILEGDCLDVLRNLPECFRVQCCVTSPPYFGLRDYGHAGQIGLESTPDEYVAKLVKVFRAVRDRLADDGTLWLNLGDSYAATVLRNNNTPNANRDGSSDASSRAIANGLNGRRVCPDVSAKNLLGIPWRVAFALQADGWYLRQDIIWHKPNPMPESVRDRCTKAHEYIFLFSKAPKYYFDSAAMQEPAVEKKAGNSKRKTAIERDCPHDGVASSVPWESTTRNRRSVWTVTTKPFKGAHFATFPPDLIEPCVLAGCPEGGTVLDPFGGAGTTGLVAARNKRNALLIELNPGYAEMARQRIPTVSEEWLDV